MVPDAIIRAIKAKEALPAIEDAFQAQLLQLLLQKMQRYSDYRVEGNRSVLRYERVLEDISTIF